MDSPSRRAQLAAPAPVDLPDGYCRGDPLLVARQSRHAASHHLCRHRGAAPRLPAGCLVEAIASAASPRSSPRLDRNMPTRDFNYSLPEDLSIKVRDRIAACRDQGVVRRIWDRDASVWSNGDEDRWLGWLTLPMQERDGVMRVVDFANDLRAEGINDVVLLGMGGDRKS